MAHLCPDSGRCGLCRRARGHLPLHHALLAYAASLARVVQRCRLRHGLPHLCERNDARTEAGVMTDRAEQMQLIEDCETRESRLSDWEAKFLDSIKQQLSAGRDLSEKQSDRLDEIW